MSGYLIILAALFIVEAGSTWIAIYLLHRKVDDAEFREQRREKGL